MSTVAPAARTSIATRQSTTSYQQGPFKESETRHTMGTDYWLNVSTYQRDTEWSDYADFVKVAKGGVYENPLMVGTSGEGLTKSAGIAGQVGPVKANVGLGYDEGNVKAPIVGLGVTGYGAALELGGLVSAVTVHAEAGVNAGDIVVVNAEARAHIGVGVEGGVEVFAKDWAIEVGIDAEVAFLVGLGVSGHVRVDLGELIDDAKDILGIDDE